MTVALCLYCGSFKLGALVPCPACGHERTGDTGLDLSFSDWYISPVTLEALGGVVRTIRANAGDPELTLWTFLSYLNGDQVTPPAAHQAAVDTLLRKLSLPKVEIQPSGRAAGTPPAPPERTIRDEALSGLVLVTVVGGTAWLLMSLEQPVLALIFGCVGGLLWRRLRRRGPRTIAVQGTPPAP